MAPILLDCMEECHLELDFRLLCLFAKEVLAVREPIVQLPALDLIPSLTHLVHLRSNTLALGMHLRC